MNGPRDVGVIPLPADNPVTEQVTDADTVGVKVIAWAVIPDSRGLKSTYPFVEFAHTRSVT